MASDNTVDDYFVERLDNVSFANGVFRISLGTQEENDTRASVRLMIPANQISSILQGMASAARNIDQKVQAKMGAKGKTKASGNEGCSSNKRSPSKAWRKEKIKIKANAPAMHHPLMREMAQENTQKLCAVLFVY